jgi:hypothetical protein
MAAATNWASADGCLVRFQRRNEPIAMETNSTPEKYHSKANRRKPVAVIASNENKMSDSGRGDAWPGVKVF